MSAQHPTIAARDADVVADLHDDGLLITVDEEIVLAVTGTTPELARFASNVSGALRGGIDGLARFIDVWGYADLAEEVAPSLDCAHVNALVALLDDDGRNVWLRYHLLDCDDRNEHRPKGDRS